MRKQLLIGGVVAAVCLYFVFRGISFADVFHVLSMARPEWILTALGLYCFGYFFRTLRWQILLNPIKKIPAVELFNPLVIGFFANNILPFRMGEFVRAHITGRKFKISRTASLGTILLERLCDTIAFLSTFIAVALFFPFPAMVEKGAAALAIACAAVIITLFLILRHQQRFHLLLDRSPVPAAWKEKILDTINNFAQGISGMSDWRYVVSALAYSLIVWTIEGSFLYLIARAFQVPLGYPQSFFLLFFMGLSVTLPQAPGYVGSLELFGVTALSLLGIPKDHGLPVILAIHGIQFIYIMILGFWALWKEGLTLENIIAEGRVN